MCAILRLSENNRCRGAPLGLLPWGLGAVCSKAARDPALPRAQFIANQALLQQDTLSEWLRRWTRNPLGSARKGSNPLGVALPQAPQTSTPPPRSCNSPAPPLASQACGHLGRRGSMHLLNQACKPAAAAAMCEYNYPNQAHRSAVV